MQNWTDGVSDEETTQVSGHVKWFDPRKGFGFIVYGEDNPDILLHANVLRNFGQSSVADGSGIDVIVQRTDRGVQAVEVVSIAPPEGGDAMRSELYEIEHSAALDIALEPARVKWFDKQKGFGFANVFAKSSDIFLHAEVLRRSGLADLQPGEAIGVRVVDGQRGQMAIQICSWETALTQD